VSLGRDESGKKQELLRERISRLNGKIAIAYVGGRSESELNENRDKLVDSLNATKNTLKSGMLPGGGTAMAHASKLLDFVPVESEEEKLGL
jgi:chaperonin GroEL